MIPVGFLLEEFLLIKQFVCGVEVNFSPKNALSILRTANVNIVTGLEDLTKRYILDHFGDFNSVEVLNFAQKYNIQDLKEYCVWYFEVNSEVTEKMWKGIKSDELRNEIEAGKWPGDRFFVELEKWNAMVEEGRQKLGKKNTDKKKKYLFF